MKDNPLNFKVSDKTMREFQEIMNKLDSDNQTAYDGLTGHQSRRHPATL